MNIRFKTILTIAVLAAVLLSAAPAFAATCSVSATAPSINGFDIANYGTVTGTDKWWTETKAAGDPKGQTFTIGDDQVILNAITYEVAPNQSAETTKTYVIRVSTIDKVDPANSATWVLEPFYTEEATQDTVQWIGASKAATEGVDPAPFMTWTFDSPLTLPPNTEYAIDIGITSSTSGWETGIPYLNRTADEYAGGTRYSSPNAGAGIGTTSMTNVSGDMIFHLDIDSGDPNAPVVDAGANWITWSGRSVKMNPTVVNRDPAQPELTYLWTAEPADGVVFSDPVDPADPNSSDALAPDVTITKDTDDPSVVTISLAVTRPGSEPITGTLKIDVYDTACDAGIANGQVTFDTTDLNGDCLTNLADFAVLAADWLADYSITAPVEKP